MIVDWQIDLQHALYSEDYYYKKVWLNFSKIETSREEEKRRNILFLCAAHQHHWDFLPTTYLHKSYLFTSIMENNQHHWIVLGEVYDNRYYIRSDRKRKPRRVCYGNGSSNGSKPVKKFNMAAKLPVEIWMKIFSYCDVATLDNLKRTCVDIPRFLTKLNHQNFRSLTSKT